MTQCEKTENQAEQNKSHAVARIEAHPTPPHSRFVRNDRCNLAHADLQRGITWREVWAPERIEEMDDSRAKVMLALRTMRTFAATMPSLIVGALPILCSLATTSLPCRDAPHSRFYAPFSGQNSLGPD